VRTSPLSRVRRALGSQIGALLLFSVVLLIAWETYGRQPDTFAIPPASEVFVELLGAFVDPLVLGYIGGTLGVALTGFTIAAVVGVAVAFVIARSAVGRDAIDPLVSALNAAPMSALLPVVLLWFGLSKTGNVFIVFMFAVFVVIINTEAGIRQVPPEFLEAGRTFGIHRRPLALYWEILLPGAAPLVFNGLRLGMGRAITGAVFADLLLRVDNLGEFLRNAGNTFNMPRLLAGVLITTVIGFLAIQATNLAERWLLPWQQGRGGQS
jgi:ABC-type nitrate/sulfonate/bicarbonate transport system permease component